MSALEHLRELTNLRDLDLTSTKITDTGLANLTGLTNLKTLGLLDTKVTDAGLVHLKGLNKLVSLLLPAQVTDAGVSRTTEGLA